MSTPFLGEFRLFAGNFAPTGHALTNGQILAINQNTALFSLLGTFYGGNGTSNFALPDLRGRMPLHQGQGAGLSSYVIGEVTGTESETLLLNEMPQHTHLAQATNAAATTASPAGRLAAALTTPWTGFYVQDANKTGSPVGMSPTALKTRGSGQAHENRMPVMAISYIIALNGIFPSRN